MATIDPVVAKALQNQLNFERFSAAVYEAMGALLEAQNLDGMSRWMYRQAQEEMAHAAKFRTFLADNNVTPEIAALASPTLPAYGGLASIGAACFDAALTHEKKVTERIDLLFLLARGQNDFASEVFLQWFVTEQVEEEKVLEEILTRFALAGDNGAAILLIDQALGGR